MFYVEYWSCLGLPTIPSRGGKRSRSTCSRPFECVRQNDQHETNCQTRVKARHHTAVVLRSLGLQLTDDKLIIVVGYPVRTEECRLVLVSPPAVPPLPGSAASVAALVPHEAVAHPFPLEANALRGALHVLPSTGLFFFHCNCSRCSIVLLLAGTCWILAVRLKT